MANDETLYWSTRYTLDNSTAEVAASASMRALLKNTAFIGVLDEIKKAASCGRYSVIVSITGTFGADIIACLRELNYHVNSMMIDCSLLDISWGDKRY